MFKFDFSYDNILTPDEVKQKGILLDERFTFEDDYSDRLFYTDENNVKVPFSGLGYDLYPNGNISGYCYIKDGYREGEDVDFYDNGNIFRYVNYNQTESTAYIIKWSKDGTINEIKKMIYRGYYQKCIEYDENGNIINQYER